MLSSLISAIEVPVTVLSRGFEIHLNALGQFVKLIIESVGYVGVGVIVFALILKAITTPFDVYQRIKMRKQNLIMRQMKPELEKLQKQYANDKQTYSMKMYELQKKNGYSMFGACLPMIISLVVIIIAITAFQSYAQYANLAMYSDMAGAYDDAILEYAVDGKEYRLHEEGVDDDELTVSFDTFGEAQGDKRVKREDGMIYTMSQSGNIVSMQVESESQTVCLYYTYILNVDSAQRRQRSYFADAEKLRANEQIWTDIERRLDGASDENSVRAACQDYFADLGAEAAAKQFRKKSNPRFLWVKNVWYPDVSYNHPIQEYNAFKDSFRSGIISSEWEGERSIAEVIDKDAYNSLTARLEDEKNAPNGYFIMIVISIGLMLLSQFITMRSSKETNQYQTVDGQGALTQKIMMVMMPIMFAVFGFMWSAAFTIYNVISSFISIVTTLLTNLIIGRIFAKREEEEVKARYTRSVPWKKGEKNRKNKS